MIDTLINYINSLDPVLMLFTCSILIVLESIIPILPLAIFIALNSLILGSFYGFIVSWASTCIGCFLSFYIVKKGFRKWFLKSTKNNQYINKIIPFINNIPFPNLAVLFAIPFMPAFALNIAAGISDMKKRKFIAVILLAKIVTVYFWGFIGTSLLESITNYKILLKLIVILYIVYMLSKAAMEKYKLD